jgi:hypothetical protein
VGEDPRGDGPGFLALPLAELASACHSCGDDDINK